MSIHILIDGYNLIRQSPELSELDRQDIQLGRAALIDMLVVYKKLKHHKITIVFDGVDAPFFSRNRDQVKGIKIIFSRQGELADAVIKRIAAREREKVLVVSSDRDIVNFAASLGAATISSPEFEKKAAMAAFMGNGFIDSTDDDNSGWIPTTKKKGPSRRLGKKDRRSRIKIRKL
ncbi:MAG: hypothetical protein DRH32_07465 [Deltaproteobacteria bacterium]|nr:MAG: hypothetical protein DRH32_07465 [Deltaproteobacteria bacterium]